MKAIIQSSYGSPDVFDLREIDMPIIKDNELLIRVHAAGLHAGDYYCMRGVPYAVRFVVGFPKPKNYIPGYDVAGTVEVIGNNVTRFQPGDEVFGACVGSCAEYVATKEDHIVPKPGNITFEEVAAVPTSALAALHGLRDAGKLQAEQNVLINGASGGVGTFAVQIAKSFGAEVTGVCSTRNMDMVRSIGADHAIDYTHEDFTQSDQRYDLILDNVANLSFSASRRALTKNGRMIPNSGHAGMGYVIRAYVRSAFIHQQGRPFLSVPNAKDLLFLKTLIESGKLTPVIDTTYPLIKTPEAIEYIGDGHARGKVVITV